MANDGSSPRSRRRSVTADEARIWRAVTRDVAPLAGRGPMDAPPEGPPEGPDAPPPPGPSAPAAPRPLPTHPSRPAERRLLPSLHLGQSPGVDKRTAQRMKRGEMVIDGRLDLHGLTQDAAYAQLVGFVLRAFDSGRRCLLVITGKGRDGGGVLRGQVPRWLNQPPLRERVLGFSHARPNHGGEGALYVLVKRRREGVSQ